MHTRAPSVCLAIVANVTSAIRPIPGARSQAAHIYLAVGIRGWSWSFAKAYWPDFFWSVWRLRPFGNVDRMAKLTSRERA